MSFVIIPESVLEIDLTFEEPNSDNELIHGKDEWMPSICAVDHIIDVQEIDSVMMSMEDVVDWLDDEGWLKDENNFSTKDLIVRGVFENVDISELNLECLEDTLEFASEMNFEQNEDEDEDDEDEVVRDQNDDDIQHFESLEGVLDEDEDQTEELQEERAGDENFEMNECETFEDLAQKENTLDCDTDINLDCEITRGNDEFMEHRSSEMNLEHAALGYEEIEETDSRLYHEEEEEQEEEEEEEEECPTINVKEEIFREVMVVSVEDHELGKEIEKGGGEVNELEPPILIPHTTEDLNRFTATPVDLEEHHDEELDPYMIMEERCKERRRLRDRKKKICVCRFPSCEFVALNKMLLMTHRRNVHGIRKTRRSVKLPFKCRHNEYEGCEFKTKTLELIKEHLRRAHLRAYYFQCRLCHCYYFESDEMTSHTKTIHHADEDPFQSFQVLL